jgi:LacI family transcriptional regulator
MQHRIAILVETSHASARETLRGVAAFVRDSAADWAIDHEPKRLEAGPPEWFRRWRGDGVIARLHCRRTAEAVARSKLPAVDMLGVARHTARRPRPETGMIPAS